MIVRQNFSVQPNKGVIVGGVMEPYVSFTRIAEIVCCISVYFLSQLLLNDFAYVMEKGLERRWHETWSFTWFSPIQFLMTNLILNDILRDYAWQVPKIVKTLCKNILCYINAIIKDIINNINVMLFTKHISTINQTACLLRHEYSALLEYRNASVQSDISVLFLSDVSTN